MKLDQTTIIISQKEVVMSNNEQTKPAQNNENGCSSIKKSTPATFRENVVKKVPFVIGKSLIKSAKAR